MNITTRKWHVQQRTEDLLQVGKLKSLQERNYWSDYWGQCEENKSPGNFLNLIGSKLSLRAFSMLRGSAGFGLLCLTGWCPVGNK